MTTFDGFRIVAVGCFFTLVRVFCLIFCGRENVLFKDLRYCKISYTGGTRVLDKYEDQFYPSTLLTHLKWYDLVALASILYHVYWNHKIEGVLYARYAFLFKEKEDQIICKHILFFVTPTSCWRSASLPMQKTLGIYLNLAIYSINSCSETYNILCNLLCKQ